MRKILQILLLLVSALMMGGSALATTYKLTQVTSISGLTSGAKFVLKQGNNVLTTVNSKTHVIQSTTTFSTTGLLGTESYVVTLEKNGSTTNYYIKTSDGKYLGNTSNSTNMLATDTKGDAIAWSFVFQGDNTVKIQNNNDRFLGNNGYNAYRAYGIGGESLNPWQFVVYILEEGDAVSIPVHFSVNGQIVSTSNFSEGDDIVFPDNPASVGGKVFVGWTNAVIDGTTNISPILAKNEKMGALETTYYAVFATLISGGGTSTVDNLTKESIGVTSYTSWSDRQWTSSAKYAGYSTMGYDEKSIQMNATSPSGIVSTTSGGKLSKVEVEWTSTVIQDTRSIQIFGKNTAYSEAGDLYNDNKKGTLLGTIVCGTSTEYTIDGDYAYVGLRSAENSITLDKISITWTNGTPDTYTNYCTTITAVPVTMGTAGYATFACTEALDLSTLPDGLTAYRAVVDGKTVTFKPISQAVPANTGLLLKGANNGNYEITIANSGAEVEGGNAFLVNTAGTTFSADNDYYYFGLKKDTFTFGTFDPATVAIPANKAYLKIAKSAFPAGARELSLVFEEESTGMDASLVNSEKRILNSEIYDLQGRRVVKPVKGLYIVNGKKVMVE